MGEITDFRSWSRRISSSRLVKLTRCRPELEAFGAGRLTWRGRRPGSRPRRSPCGSGGRTCRPLRSRRCSARAPRSAAPARKGAPRSLRPGSRPARLRWCEDGPCRETKQRCPVELNWEYSSFFLTATEHPPHYTHTHTFFLNKPLSSVTLHFSSITFVAAGPARPSEDLC